MPDPASSSGRGAPAAPGPPADSEATSVVPVNGHKLKAVMPRTKARRGIVICSF